MRLRTKLTLTFALLAVVPLAVVGPWSAAQLRGVLSNELEARLSAAAELTRTYVAQLQEETKRSVDELAVSSEVEELAQALYNGTPPVRLKGRAAELMASRRLSVLSLLDAKGKTLASSHLPARVGDVDEPLFSATHPAAAGPEAFLVEVRTETDVKQVPALVAAAATTYSLGDLRLWVIGGHSLDAQLCQKLSAMTGARVELWSEGNLLAAAGEASAPLTQSVPLGPHAEVRVSFGRSALVLAESSVLTAFLTVTALALFLALALGYWMARRTTRPVEALTRATREVAIGQWRSRVNVRATGELGQLVEAFNRMTEEIETTTQKLISTERIAAWQEIARRLAHELKNPLTPIQMSLETLLAARKENHPSFDALFAQSAVAILEEVERLKKIVDAFSRFARLPKAEPVSLDVGQWVAQVLSLYPNDQRVQVETTIAADVRVLADRDQLTQVLLNLLQNGHDAIGERGGKIWVRVRAHDGQAIVEVEDTGPGVPADLRQRIFEPYFTQKNQGTGLGLAISARICQEHGGSLTVSGDPPRGALFLLALPLEP